MAKKKMKGAALALAACMALTTVVVPAATTETAYAATKTASSYTGLKKVNGTWYQYKNGKRVSSGTDVVKNQYGWWYCKNGKVDFHYTGLATNKNGTWYCKNGKVDFKYSRTYTDGEYKYTLKGGKVVAKEALIDYDNVYFDYSAEIAEQIAAVATTPEAAAIEITAKDTKGASGSMLVASVDAENTTDYYLNAVVAGNAIEIAPQKGKEIKSVTSSVSGKIAVKKGKAYVVPAAIDAADPVDETITVEMKDGSKYVIHTVNELLPDIEITGEGVAEADAGVYSIAIDKFMLRVNSDGELIYYRNMNCVGSELMCENFAAQDGTDDSRYYTAFVELEPEYRNANGGYSSGYYLVMDKNYKDIDKATLEANNDKNHTHGEGYLDQHEFIVLGEDHYICLSYTLENVDNLPASVEGIDGTSSTYVWAGIIQEVKDGKVIQEINTTDYPLLYDSAVEKLDYANATLEGTTVTVGQNSVVSFADGIMDYVHVNSVDYTLDKKGNVDNILVSMRDQSAVYEFDFQTRKINWILGGKASTLSGYDAYTTERTDEAGNTFQALTFGQHYARYMNKDARGMIKGNEVISVFNNQTGTGPFLTTSVPYPTLTRTFVATINTKKATATISDVIDGTALNELNDKYHIASHCGSVTYDSATSVTIGWGLHGVIDNIGKYAPTGTVQDPTAGYPDLRQGTRPVFTDYNPSTGTISMELSVTRNPKLTSSEGLFSYRTYKNAY